MPWPRRVGAATDKRKASVTPSPRVVPAVRNSLAAAEAVGARDAPRHDCAAGAAGPLEFEARRLPRRRDRALPQGTENSCRWIDASGAGQHRAGKDARGPGIAPEDRARLGAAGRARIATPYDAEDRAVRTPGGESDACGIGSERWLGALPCDPAKRPAVERRDSLAGVPERGRA